MMIRARTSVDEFEVAYFPVVGRISVDGERGPVLESNEVVSCRKEHSIKDEKVNIVGIPANASELSSLHAVDQNPSQNMACPRTDISRNVIADVHVLVIGQNDGLVEVAVVAPGVVILRGEAGYFIVVFRRLDDAQVDWGEVYECAAHVDYEEHQENGGHLLFHETEFDFNDIRTSLQAFMQSLQFICCQKLVAHGEPRKGDGEKCSRRPWQGQYYGNKINQIAEIAQILKKQHRKQASFTQITSWYLILSDDIKLNWFNGLQLTLTNFYNGYFVENCRRGLGRYQPMTRAALKELIRTNIGKRPLAEACRLVQARGCSSDSSCLYAFALCQQNCQ